MKMPMNLAKEFAEFECTPQDFADRMTMSGSKVETYECEADGIKNVVVGKILEIVPHPDSDHMVVCQVDVGRDAPVQPVRAGPYYTRLSKRRRGPHSGAGRGMARGHRRCEGAWYGRRVRGF